VLLGLLALAGLAARADITLKLDVMDGDKISDVTKIVAHAASAEGIDKVEFRVDDQLRYTDTSTPYEYEWDTIVDMEGAHRLTITAYDSAGHTKRAAVSLTIDNELNLGGAALAQKAQEALAARDSAAALKYSRRALKADPDNIEAARVLAGRYAAQMDWDKAITTLEKAKRLEDSSAAMQDMAQYRIRRALLPENAATLLSEIEEVNRLRRKAGEMNVKEVRARVTGADGKVTAEGHVAIGDALMSMGRFSDAAAEYGPAALGADAPASGISRLGLAQVLSGQSPDAIRLLRPVIRAKKDDAAVRAVYGLALLYQRQFADARAAVQSDLADHVPAALVIAAYADSVLANVDASKRRDAVAAARDSVSLLPKAGEAQYALSMSTTNSVDAEHALLNTLALAPFQVGPYLDYAAHLAASRRQDRYDQALNMADLVLKMDPNNVAAKLTQAMVYLQTKRPEAATTLDMLKRKEPPTAADILLALAVYWNVQNIGGNTTYYMGQAAKNDPTFFTLSAVPTPIEYLLLVNRKLHYRGGFFLTPDTLYPKS
jgi:tetratricopeptide (TPR) repeat protein